MDADVLEELLDLERLGWASLCDGTGSNFYGSLMAPGAMMVLANGYVMSRDEVVEALADAPLWTSYEISSARVVPVGADVTALLYVGTGQRPDADDFVGVMTSVYARREGGWDLVLYQQTPMSQ